MIRVLLASFIVLGACAAEPASAPPATQDEQKACGWLAGGDCAGKDDGTVGVPSGDWRSPDFWADMYLAKYARQRAAALQNIEPGPPPLAQPRTVLLITGATIRAKWFDPIVARLKRDGFVPVVYEPPALLSGSLEQATQDLAAVVEQVRAQSGQDKVDILAECTGGVIARHYIQSFGGADKVSRLVTFVSPQAGIALAPLVAKIVG